MYRHTSSVCPKCIDVEIYTEHGKGQKRDKLWACPFLAAIWQGLRTGALSDPGFEDPYAIQNHQPDWSEFGNKWNDLPPLMQLNPEARPFVAQRTFSILPLEFFQVETAAQMIIAAALPNTLPRIAYVFLHGLK